MRDRSAWFRIPVAVGAVFLALFVCACAAKPRTAGVTYYYKSGAPGLAERLASIAALEQEFPERVLTRAVDSGSAEAQRDLEHLEIGTAGVVVRNSNSVLLYKQGESAFDIARVRDAIRAGLDSKTR